MNLELLSSILNKLTLHHERVSLPGLGSFVGEVAPAYFSLAGKAINPPYRRILFRSKELHNDGLLTECYAKELEISREVAEEKLHQFAEWLKIELSEKQHFKFPNFGTIRATADNDYYFVAQQGIFNYIEAFGLEPVTVSHLTPRGKIERLRGRRVRNFFKIKPTFPTLPAPKELSAALSDEELSEEQINIDIDEQSVVQELEGSETITLVENIIEEDIVAEEIISDKIVAEEIDSSDTVIEDKPEEDAQDSFVPPQLKESKNSTFKIVVITLSIIFAILVIIILLHHFREELHPLLEKILYNKEERELLRQLY